MKQSIKQMLLTMLVALVSVSTFAYDFESNGIYYNITSMSNLEVEVTSGTYSGDISIPETVNYNNRTFSVTAIGNSAFSNKKITSIVFPKSIISIGNDAFHGCNSLTSVEIPNSVTSIGYEAFRGIGISSLVIPSNVTSIGYRAFSYCSSLMEVFFTSTTKPKLYKNDAPFIGCHSALEIYVPSKEVYGFGIEYLTFPTNSYEYNGGQHSIEWQNNLKAYTCEIATEECSTEKNVGTYTKELNVKYSNGLDLSLKIPYSYEITKAPLTLTVNDVQREYGEANPVFTSNISGFVGGESVETLGVSPSYECEATKLSNAGSYRILASLDAANYEVTYNYGTLTIQKAPLKMSVKDAEMTYGSKTPSAEFSYVGLKNNESEPTWDTTPTVSTEATYTSSVGQYSLKLSGGIAKNYEITERNNGTLTIKKKDLTVKATDCERNYGDDNPEFLLSYVGFVNNETKDVVTEPTASCKADKTSNAGQYEITVAGGEAKNYEFVYQTGTLTVLPLTVCFKNETSEVTYNDMSVSTMENYFNYIPEITGPFSEDDFWLELWYLDKDNKESNHVATIQHGSFSGNYVNTSSGGTMNAGKYIFNITSKGKNPNVAVGKLSRTYVTVNTAQSDLEWNTSSPIMVEVGDTIDLGISYTGDIYNDFKYDYDNTLVQLYKKDETGPNPHWFIKGLKEGTTKLSFGIDCIKNDLGCYNYYDSRTLSKTITVVPSSGIEGVKADNQGRVRVYNGKLHFEGFPDNAHVAIYNVTGTLMFSGNINDVPLISNGLYIVKIQSKVVKVVVK